MFKFETALGSSISCVAYAAHMDENNATSSGYLIHTECKEEVQRLAQ